jgi:Mn2+/Fe2+ NRAMP family transporter
VSATGGRTNARQPGGPPDRPASRGWRRPLVVIGPGLLIAATGVGAGDLATAGFAGSRLGTAILWAVLLGAAFKYVLTEAIARWQLMTGQTLLTGALTQLGRPARGLFLAYLLPWSFFVGAALISACGVAFLSLLPGLAGGLPPTASGKLLWGAAHSLLGVVLVWSGGYRLIERIMAVCIGVMFISVLGAVVLIRPEPLLLLRGLVPRIPEAGSGGLTWTIALIGGVGGTLTILCYGYWIREEGRAGPRDLAVCRLDLAAGYLATAAFGMAMIVLAAGLRLDGRGLSLVLELARRLEERIGPQGRWIFLVGAYAAILSSLLGVWQAVPYIFADTWRIIRGRTRDPVSTNCRPYRLYLLLLASVPLLQVGHPFRQVQKIYAIVGAAFLPLLALVLLVLGSRRHRGRYRNGPLGTTLLLLVLLLSLAAAIMELRAG